MNKSRAFFRRNHFSILSFLLSVLSVLSFLSVLSLSSCAPYLSRGQRTDAGIKYSVEKKLMFAGVDSSHLVIEVVDGVVTVAGLAADRTQRKAIFKTLENVPGASRVYIHVDVDDSTK